MPMPRAARWGTLLTLAAIMALGGHGLRPSAALAQQAAEETETGIPRPVIGVIDLQRVLREASAARSVRADRERYVTAYQAEAAQAEQDLRAADQDLVRLRADLSPEEFAAKRREFQEEVATTQRNVQVRRRNLERAFGAAMSEVQQATIRIADEVAAENGVNVILYRSQVFLFDNDMDLTETILARLDERLPEVEFPDPATMDAAPPPATETPSSPLPLTGD